MKDIRKRQQTLFMEVLSIFRDSTVRAVMLLSFFILTSFLGILIAQRQQLNQQISSLSAPESRPFADGNNAVCEMVISIEDQSNSSSVKCDSKTFDSAETEVGKTGEFTIKLTKSPAAAESIASVTILDNLPEELSFYQFIKPSANVGANTATADSVTCEHSDGTITCEFDKDSTEDSITIKYFVEETDSQRTSNTASVSHTDTSTTCSDELALVNDPPPEVPCENCTYQFDAYWGPVIKSFREDGKRYRYHTSGPNGGSRLLRSRSSRSISTGYANCEITESTSNGSDAPIVEDYPCDNTNPSSYLSADIDTSTIHIDNGGYATATIRNASSSCAVEVGFASYRVDDSLSDPEIFDTQEYITDTSTILQPGETVEISVPTAMVEKNENQCVDEPGIDTKASEQNADRESNSRQGFAAPNTDTQSDSGDSDSSNNQVNSVEQSKEKEDESNFGGFGSALEFIQSFFSN